MRLLHKNCLNIQFLTPFDYILLKPFGLQKMCKIPFLCKILWSLFYVTKKISVEVMVALLLGKFCFLVPFFKNGAVCPRCQRGTRQIRNQRKQMYKNQSKNFCHTKTTYCIFTNLSLHVVSISLKIKYEKRLRVKNDPNFKQAVLSEIAATVGKCNLYQ